jgi:hypothetical protein
MALSPTSSRGGGGGAADIEAVLTEGDDASDLGIQNLGDTLLAGAIQTAGNSIRGGETEDTARLSVSSAASGSALIIGDSPASGAGGSGSIEGGLGANFVTNGALAFAQGGDGDGVTHGRFRVRTANVFGSLGQTLVSDGANYLIYGTLGSIKLDTHAAPADGDLAAGELRLWFDQTNGAAKLMVKAKSADGTVVTAAVALA